MSTPESRQLGNYTVDDIEAVFSHQEITEIDEYQREQVAHPRNILQNPIPPSVIDNHRKHIHILTANTSRFDEEVRAMIKDDPVIKILEEARRKGYPTHDIAEARCARRSVIAYLAVKSTVL